MTMPQNSPLIRPFSSTSIRSAAGTFGNPGMVIASGIDWGTEVWASHQGRAIAIGRYQAGELHPSRVFN